MREIEALRAQGMTLDDPLHSGAMTVFPGQPERELREALAAFFLSATPSLAWEATHCHASRDVTDRRDGGPADGWFGRQRLSTVLDGCGGLRLSGDPAAEVSGPVVTPLGSLAERQQLSAQYEPDLLFHSGIATPNSYFLACARQAPLPYLRLGHHAHRRDSQKGDGYLTDGPLDPPGAGSDDSERVMRCGRPTGFP